MFFWRHPNRRVPIRLRLLLDTNILIPLEDSLIVLESSLANFIRLAGVGGHTLIYHPASIRDIERDTDLARRSRTLSRLAQYTILEGAPVSPLNTTVTSANDAADNDILYALECEAAHALVSEDREIHAKARRSGLAGRVYTIQTAEDWLRRLHETSTVRLPNIEDVALHSLIPILSNMFFDSLKAAYPGFEAWFRSKAREGRRAWIYRDERSELAAICIYAVQEDAQVTEQGLTLPGRALKLCTFKVGELVRGRKVGELFLKAAFRYATENSCQNVFIHGNASKQMYLMELLEDFGFGRRGTYHQDEVMVKEHPQISPALSVEPTQYCRRFYPHFRDDESIAKYIVPIRPQYHRILFPDYISIHDRQLDLFRPPNYAGNAIKLAYLCHTPIKSIQPGAVLFFYRTEDDRAITTVGVVELFAITKDPARIAELVSRRTVYSQQEIEQLAMRETKVILFRLVGNLPSPVGRRQMDSLGIARGPIQTIRKLDHEGYQALRRVAGWAT